MWGMVLVAGLAAFTIWHALARVQPPGVRQLYAALPGPLQRFVGCPWCAGAWLAFAAVLALTWGHWHPIETPILALAAAAVPGVLDSLTPDDGSVIG